MLDKMISSPFNSAGITYGEGVAILSSDAEKSEAMVGEMAAMGRGNWTPKQVRTLFRTDANWKERVPQEADRVWQLRSEEKLQQLQKTAVGKGRLSFRPLTARQWTQLTLETSFLARLAYQLRLLFTGYGIFHQVAITKTYQTTLKEAKACAHLTDETHYANLKAAFKGCPTIDTLLREIELTSENPFALHHTIKAGDVDQVEELAKDKGLLNRCDSEGKTPLKIALDTLLQLKIPSPIGNNQNRIDHLYRIVELLLQRGAKPTIATEIRRTGDEALLKLAKPFLPPIKTIWEAIDAQDLAAVKQYSKDTFFYRFSRQRQKGNSPLHYALKRINNEEILLHLVKKTDDLKVANSQGKIPLDLARGKIATAIQNKMGIEPIPDDTNIPNSPLHEEILAGKTPTISDSLLEQTDAAGNTPLLLALKCRSPDATLHALLDAGASVQEKNNQRETALHLAISSGAPYDVIRKILTKNPPLNALYTTISSIRTYPLTPLQLALNRGKDAIIELLLAEKKIDHRGIVTNKKISEKLLYKLYKMRFHIHTRPKISSLKLEDIPQTYPKTSQEEVPLILRAINTNDPKIVFAVMKLRPPIDPHPLRYALSVKANQPVINALISGGADLTKLTAKEKKRCQPFNTPETIQTKEQGLQLVQQNPHLINTVTLHGYHLLDLFLLDAQSSTEVHTLLSLGANPKLKCPALSYTTYELAKKHKDKLPQDVFQAIAQAAWVR